MYIRIGKIETYNQSVDIFIGKETAKAVQLKICRTRKDIGKLPEQAVWLPKSQIIERYNEYWEVSNWIIKEKGLPGFRMYCTLNSGELREKKGLELSSLTLRDRVEMVSEGYIKIIMAEDEDTLWIISGVQSLPPQPQPEPECERETITHRGHKYHILKEGDEWIYRDEWGRPSIVSHKIKEEAVKAAKQEAEFMEERE